MKTNKLIDSLLADGYFNELMKVSFADLKTKGAVSEEGYTVYGILTNGQVAVKIFYPNRKIAIDALDEADKTKPKGSLIGLYENNELTEFWL